MSQKIKAAVAVDTKRTEVCEFELPALPPDGGLLKVEMTGVCGSDWPYYLNSPKSKGPLILGHETVGFVAELGKAAAAKWGVKEGDRVALEEYLPCGYCAYCRSGDFRLCDKTDIFIGKDSIRYGSTPISRAPSLWGGYSEYQYLHPNAVFHKVPAHVPAMQAALALPLGNGVEWSYLQGGAGIGQAVVIQGPGQQGLACVIAAKEAGASLIIVSGLSTSSDQRRLALARKLGATHTVDIDNEDLVEKVAHLTNGAMADLVLDCASGGPATIVSAIKLARKRGRVILGGWKRRPIPEFDSDVLISRFLTVKGVRGHSYESVEMALQIIASQRYPLAEMCTHLFGLNEVDEALRTVGGEGKPDAIHCSVDPWK
ncbi:MAG: alcohol dehydrogenase catalytic domain-containing protein [Burkholderiales bacterium]|nr:alcohol dehydrogenase catalytic domain-containing protein [Burkholderiales bacterium]